MPTDELPLEAEKPVAAGAPIKAADLSSEIAAAVEKQPGDRVKVARVWGDHYRCNWIAPRNRLEGSLLESYHIRQSRFLKVTRSGDGELVITDMTASN